MFKPHSFKFCGALVLIFAIALTSCTSRKDMEKLARTSDNTALESFVPEDAWFVYSYFPTSETQRLLLKDHSQTIFQGREEALWDIFLNPFLKESLKKAVKHLLLENAPVVYSMSGVGTEVQIDFRVTFSVKDPQALQKIFEENAESQEIMLTKLDAGFSFEQFDPRFYGKFDGKFLHLSNNALAFPLEENTGDKKSILESKFFKKALKKLSTDRIGYFFMQQSENTAAIALGTPSDVMSITNVLAEQDGVRLYGFSEIPKHPSRLLPNLLFANTNTYLDSKIPAKDIVAYIESHHLADLIKFEFEIFKQHPLLKGAFKGDLEEILEKKIGLSFEKDIYPALKKNFAVMLEDQDKILPAISIWADVSSGRKTAEKLVKQLDAALSSFVTLINVGSGQELMNRRKIMWNGAEITQIAFYPEKYPQDQFPIPLFANLSEEWNLMYGILDSGLLFLTTRAEFPNAMAADDSLYNELKGKVPDFDKTQRSFVSFEPIRNYLTRIVVLGKKSGKISEREITGIDVFWRLISPIRGVISGMRQNGSWMETQTFIKIGI